ncbi:MAG TPA: acyl-CoA dehydrogenase family protein, partial [Kofleriaceae bacterium]
LPSQDGILGLGAVRGFTTATFPRELGAGGRPFTELVTIFEEVVGASAALITIFQAGETIHVFGNDSLKQRYLPRFADGLLCSFAMTEARGGSDVKQLDARARPPRRRVVDRPSSCS